jgi:hypothetical protein
MVERTGFSIRILIVAFELTDLSQSNVAWAEIAYFIEGLNSLLTLSYTPL